MAENEAVLLRRFTGSGDAQAFAEIIRRHAGLVYGAALRILADVDRASDVAQDTFLQLTKDAGTVTGSLPGWLHRVATHKAIDQMRREASRRHREKEYATQEEPVEVNEWKEISPYVDAGLRELDPQLREVLIQHFLEGRTTREIAAAYGTSQATVSRRIGAGVEQLRAKLRKRGILVAVGALSVLLGDNGVQAAPLTLLTELGKMAMVGGAAAGTAGAGSGAHMLATSVLTAVKGKVAAIAAVTLVGAGAVVAYYTLTKHGTPSPAVAPAALAASRPAYGMADSDTDARGRPERPGTGRPVRIERGLPAAVAQKNLQNAETQFEGRPGADRAKGGMEFFGVTMRYGGKDGTNGSVAGKESSAQAAGSGDQSQSNDPNLHDPNDPDKPQT
jgi:RNA polymerase sigma factor (sigma-70 family)